MKGPRETIGPALVCLFAWLAATAWLRPLMSPDEGLSKAAALLSQVIIKEKPAAAWWV